MYFLLPHVGAISGSIDAAAGMPFFKILGQIYNKWAISGFWGSVWGVRLENRRPIWKSALAPPNGP
jgi:hypothetical protein